MIMGITQIYGLLGSPCNYLFLFRYSCVIIVVTFKLSTHTRFWSGILVISIVFLSLGLYLAYMWISNYYFSDNIKGTNTIAWTSGEIYLVVLFCICAVLFIDGIVLHIDLIKSGTIYKMRAIIAEQKQESKSYYE